MRHEPDLNRTGNGGGLKTARPLRVPAALSSGAAAVTIAALFHDLGKATLLFQGKLARALKGGDPEADPVRHELFSAAVWDELFGNVEDEALVDALAGLTPGKVDAACKGARRGLLRSHSRPEDPLKFRLLARPGTLTHLIGLLILTHHRLPDAESDHLTLTGTAHVRSDLPLRDPDLAIAPGTPFWHEAWWGAALRAEASRLSPGSRPASGDIALRASLMFAVHVGSARKAPSGTAPDHLANTMRLTGTDGFVPADSLSRHVKRVSRYARFAHEMAHQLRDRYPAIGPDQVPLDIALPAPSSDPRFSRQAAASEAVRRVCENVSGGFFGAILAGTGTGKTRGAPTILAAAALADRDPARRQLRMSLALGLRTLATQSAREYVEDLGFRPEDVSVLIGEARRHWQQEVGGFVIPVRRAWSPGYRQRVDMNKIWADACEEAGNALAAYDVPLPALPDTCPFPIDLFVEKGFDTVAAIEHLKRAVEKLSPQREG